MATTKKLGEKGMTELLETFDALKLLAQTDIIKALNEFTDEVLKLYEENLYKRWLALEQFRAVIDSESPEGAKENEKIDDFLDRLEWIIEERMFTTTQPTKLIRGRARKAAAVWRERFMRVAKHKELFNGEIFPKIAETDEESQDERENEETTVSRISAKIPVWFQIVTICNSALVVVLIVLFFFFHNSVNDANEAVTKVSVELTQHIVHQTEKAQKDKNSQDSLVKILTKLDSTVNPKRFALAKKK